MRFTLPRPRRFGKDVFIYPLLISLFFLTIGEYVVYEMSLSSADHTIQRTLQRVKERSLYSLRFEEADKVNNLVRLLDKTQELARQTAEFPMQSTGILRRFADDMRLTGAVLLNEKMQIDSIVGISDADCRELISLSRIPDVARWPQKSSLDRVKIHDKIYDYAAVSRRDKPGVVLTVEIRNVTERKSGLFTLDILFPDDSFLFESSVFITDNQSIIDTNEKQWLGRAVTDCPILHFDGATWVRPELVRIRDDGTTWYGARTQVRELAVYVFSPQNQVLAPCVYFAAFILFLYAALQTVMLCLRQHSLSLQMKALSDKLKTIQAVSSIFTEGLLASAKDGSFEILKASDSFRPFLSGCRTTDDIVKQMADKVITEEYRDKYVAFHDIRTVEPRLKSAASGHIDFVFATRSGRWMRDVIVAQSFGSGGHLEKCLVLSNDVTEEKEREIAYQEKLLKAAREAEASVTAKTNFLRHMSHDIRTPINGILGMLEVAERHSEDPERQKTCRRHIREASLILLELINDVLDLSKLEAHQVNLEKCPFNLLKLWEETLPTMEVLSDRRNITVNITQDIRHPEVEGCPTLIRRVLMNIITNAVKYNRDNGHMDISLQEKETSPAGTVYEFRCRDTGIGMSQEFQKQAFEPFSQENETARTTYAGTGLGLAIAKRIIEQIGGTIEFTSELNVGTTFVIRIPMRVLSSQSDHTADAPSAPLSSDIRGKRILLAEDNDLNREIAEITLTDAGAHVTCACDGREAVQTYVNSPDGSFDLILMDVMMPHLNGTDAAKAIRASGRPDALTIPIVAMTANIFPEDIRATQEAGMNAHIGKPCSAEKLIAVLASLVSGNQKTRQQNDVPKS